MNGIFLAILLTSATPSFEAATLDGRSVVGPIVALTPETLTIAAASGRVSIPTTKLLAVVPTEKPAAAGAPGVVVQLADGSMIEAQQYLADGNRARITLAGGEVVEAPAATVQNVLCGALQTPELRSDWARLTGMKTDADLLIVRSDAGLDYQKGIVHEVSEDVVRFDLDGKILPAKRAKVFGLTYHHGAPAKMPPAICRIRDAAGSLWMVRSLSLGEKLQWTTPAGVSVAQSCENIARIDFSAGKLLYLSDLEPDSIVWAPYFAAGQPPPAVKQFFAPRFDRGFDSPVLRLGHVDYQKGIALRSRTELVYRLPERFGRFLAVAGIADAVRPDGKVRLVVRGDDKVLFEAAFTGSDAPRPIDLDVTGVRRLTILADFDDGINRADHLLLCNARVSK
ncbi:MAG: NPCBM/NEW2 domain-containing protein [Thermoguttaceae bacterium]